MDKKKVTVFIDTNIFIIDLRYKRDVNFNTNRKFLDFIREGKGLTSIINLLEICGILSFNLNPQQISELFCYLPEKYKIEIIPSREIDSFIQETSVKAIMNIIFKKASLGDALISNIINNSLARKSVFVSWDAAHFKDLLNIKAMTPEEFLSANLRI